MGRGWGESEGERLGGVCPLKILFFIFLNAGRVFLFLCFFRISVLSGQRG